MKSEHLNRGSKIPNTVSRVAFVAAALSFLGIPSIALAAEVESYHSYHNSLAGVVIANLPCEDLVVDPETGETVIDRIHDALDVSTDSPAFWVYDGLRTWNTRRNIPFGPYGKYFLDDGCILYTNSVSAKIALALEGVPHSPWYDAREYSVARDAGEE